MARRATPRMADINRARGPMVIARIYNGPRSELGRSVHLPINTDSQAQVLRLALEAYDKKMADRSR